MMTTITLYRNTTGWLAQWTGDGARQIRELFGTDTLPLPYTSQARPLTVLAEVQERNPEVRVELA